MTERSPGRAASPPGAETQHQAELLESLHDAVFALDRRFRITSWNRAAEETFGWPAGEVLGRPLLDVLPTEYPEGLALPEIAAALSELGRMRLQLRRRTRAGDWVELDTTLVALRDPGGELQGFVSANREDGARRGAEAALRVERDRLARVVGAAAEGISVSGASGTVELVNARAAELLGFDAAAAVGRPLLELFPPEAREEAGRALEALCRGESVRRELVVAGGGGLQRTLLFSARPLPDGEKSSAGAVAVFTDLSELRRAQDRLIQAQKLEAVGRLAAGVAHDFNNLLVVVMSAAAALQEGLAGDGALSAEVRAIQEAGERAVRLVRSLMDLAGRGGDSPAPVQVNGIVEGLTRLVTRSFSASVEVSMDLAPGLPAVWVDPSRLEQALLNLLVNARDALPTGGQVMVSSRWTGRVPGPGRVEIAVSDDGIGIAAEHLPRVFDCFFTTKEPGKGTGLGLSTVRDFVEAAGGSAAVESRPGQGTTVTLSLPARPKAEEASGPAPRGSLRGAGERVLLVEDDPQARRALRRMLERGGFGVVEAASASEAIAHLEGAQQVSAMVIDLMLPGISGEGLVAIAERFFPGLALVCISGSGRAPRASEASPVMLQKPFTEVELVQGVALAIHAASPGPR